MELRITTLIGMIGFAAMTRLLPHPPNFTAVTAMALFAGAQIADRRLALLVPLVAMFLTDLVLGLHTGMLLVYLCVALVVGLGSLAGPRLSPRLAGASIASSVLFFAVTNFGVWAMDGLYPMTLAGLGACYVAAIPFFQNGLAGDLFFTAVLFGGYELLRRVAPSLATAR
ncbi:MAG: hypothetical protein JWN07_3370 [Hyphomicrobiales bacterium]|nr:hypothetical protein [Hyphomicrobiales bacterium]